MSGYSGIHVSHFRQPGNRDSGKMETPAALSLGLPPFPNNDGNVENNVAFAPVVVYSGWFLAVPS
jgi:hypothetical protein